MNMFSDKEINDMLDELKNSPKNVDMVLSESKAVEKAKVSGPPRRSYDSLVQDAKAYVDKQIELMFRQGHEPVLSKDQYQVLIQNVASVGRTLWLNGGGVIL